MLSRRSKPGLTFILLYIIMYLVLLYHINNGNSIHVCEHQSAYVPAFNCLIKGKICTTAFVFPWFELIALIDCLQPHRACSI